MKTLTPKVLQDWTRTDDVWRGSWRFLFAKAA
jgi:hypothetical protein